MYQVHIRNKTTCRTVKYYTAVHRRKYQLHFKNVVKSIILIVRLKADNELKSVMYISVYICLIDE